MRILAMTSQDSRDMELLLLPVTREDEQVRERVSLGRRWTEKDSKYDPDFDNVEL